MCHSVIILDDYPTNEIIGPTEYTNIPLSLTTLYSLSVLINFIENNPNTIVCRHVVPCLCGVLWTLNWVHSTRPAFVNSALSPPPTLKYSKHWFSLREEARNLKCDYVILSQAPTHIPSKRIKGYINFVCDIIIKKSLFKRSILKRFLLQSAKVLSF